jgi:hypothetical protein
MSRVALFVFLVLLSRPALLFSSDSGADGQVQRQYAVDAISGHGQGIQTKGMDMNDDLNGPFAVTTGTTPESPPVGPENSLTLKLIPGTLSGAAPLVLHGSYNLSVDVTGHYSSLPPAPFLLVAIARETGRVYVRDLANDDDIPSTYLGEGAPPSVVRSGPGGSSSAGIRMTGSFRVDMAPHLTLPARSEVYDVFLWLDNILSEMATATKPADLGDSPGGRMHNRPATIATTRRISRSDELELSAAQEKGERHIRGRSGTVPVSIIAHAVESGETGWTALTMDEAHEGLEFDIKVKDLLPAARPEDRIIAIAVSGGRRSSIVNMPPLF